MLKIIAESHVDHNMTDAQRAYILELFKDKNGFFIETVDLPEHLGYVPCALYGPVCGDLPISNEQVKYLERGKRQYPSRVLYCYPERPSKKISIIAGPHGEEPCVLYTIFGGPISPREVLDPSLKEDKDLLESMKFWSEHALAYSK